MMRHKLFLTLFTLSWLASFGQNQTPIAKIPFEMDGSHIMVDAKINDSEPLPCVFDTGASMSLIDKEIAGQLGMKTDQVVNGQGASGATDFELSLNNTLQLGDLTYDSEMFLMYSLDHMKQFGSRLTGVLGFQEINKYVVKIDYVNKVLSFYDKKTFSYKGDGTIIPIGLEMNIPSIDGEITLSNGKKITGRFLIDTGAGLYGGINSPIVKENNALESLNAKYVVEASGANSTFSMTIGRVESLAFGDFTFDQLPMSFNEVESGALADPNYLGIIGNRVMNRFDIILDYENNRMILEPNTNYRDEFLVNSSGFFTKPENEKVVVDRVISGSPAETLGLKPGDILETVGTIEATPQTRLLVREMMEKHGETIPISWRRNGKKMEGSIKLKRLI